MNKIATKLYIGNEGWTGKTIHAIVMDGDTPHSRLCYVWAMQTNRPLVNVKRVQATTENVTCENCLKRLALEA